MQPPRVNQSSEIDEILGEKNLGRNRGCKPKITPIGATEPKWEAERSKTRLEGWRCLRCIFPTFLDIFEKFRPREIFWHQLDQDRLRIDGKMLVWKKKHEKKWLTLEKLLWSRLQFLHSRKFLKNFLVQKLSPFQFSRHLTLAQRPKNGSEDEWFFTLFDPLCPEGWVLGPMGWVFWSTPGGPPNHPPRPLVRLILMVLWPKTRSHSKTGRFFKSWIISRGCNIWGKVTPGGYFMSM